MGVSRGQTWIESRGKQAAWRRIPSEIFFLSFHASAELAGTLMPPRIPTRLWLCCSDGMHSGRLNELGDNPCAISLFCTGDFFFTIDNPTDTYLYTVATGQMGHFWKMNPQSQLATARRLSLSILPLYRETDVHFQIVYHLIFPPRIYCIFIMYESSLAADFLSRIQKRGQSRRPLSAHSLQPESHPAMQQPANSINRPVHSPQASVMPTAGSRLFLGQKIGGPETWSSEPYNSAWFACMLGTN